MVSTTRAVPGSALGDVGLACAIERGNGAALAEAYERYAAGVHNIARRLCGPTRAQDVVQDIFLALWQHPDRFDCDRGSLGAFLSIQARARSVDLLRSDSRRVARERADGLPRTTSSVEDVDTAAMTGLEHDELDRALGEIPGPQREAIVLAFFGGHTYREVARILEQPEGTVKSRIRAGLTRLFELLVDNPPLAAP